MKRMAFPPNSRKFQPKIVRRALSMLPVVFDECASGPKASRPRIHCAQTESAVAGYVAEFCLCRMIEFEAKDVITNHRARLNIHDRHSKIMSVINQF
jgi:hypothetical protein